MSSMAVCTERESNWCAPATPAEAVKRDPVILVVEDDAGIRRFICAVLRQLTSAFVVESAEPEAALSIARRLHRKIDLLISDIDLSSVMNGIDLAHQLAATNPLMQVLLISASDYPKAEIPATWRFLAKPFSIDLFLASIYGLCRPIPGPANYFG